MNSSGGYPLQNVQKSNENPGGTLATRIEIRWNPKGYPLRNGCKSFEILGNPNGIKIWKPTKSLWLRHLLRVYRNQFKSYEILRGTPCKMYRTHLKSNEILGTPCRMPENSLRSYEILGSSPLQSVRKSIEIGWNQKSTNCKRTRIHWKPTKS
jgi:hypothetical protein